MAKKSLIQREKKREYLINKYKMKRSSLKNELLMLNNIESSIGKKNFYCKYKFKIYKKLERMPRNSSPVRYRNRCWVTGRSRGFYRDFGLSRHLIREMAHEGMIPGLKKSSW